MKHHLARLLLPLIVLAPLSSCSGGAADTADLVSSSEPDREGEIVQLNDRKFLTGSLRDERGRIIDLKDLRDKSLVITFSNENCSDCIREVSAYKAAMPLGMPFHTRFITVMVNGDEATAMRWKTSRQLPWTVGHQAGDSLFKTWCSEGVTPCVLVQTSDEGVVLKGVGPIPVIEMEKHTGRWTDCECGPR